MEILLFFWNLTSDSGENLFIKKYWKNIIISVLTSLLFKLPKTLWRKSLKPNFPPINFCPRNTSVVRPSDSPACCVNFTCTCARHNKPQKAAWPSQKSITPLAYAALVIQAISPKQFPSTRAQSGTCTPSCRHKTQHHQDQESGGMQ